MWLEVITSNESHTSINARIRINQVTKWQFDVHDALNHR